LKKKLKELDPHLDIWKFLESRNVPFFKIFQGKYDENKLKEDIELFQQLQTNTETPPK
jgi:hypothetical protein